MHKIVIKITLLIMENIEISWNCVFEYHGIVFLNFSGNPVMLSCLISAGPGWARIARKRLLPQQNSGRR